MNVAIEMVGVSKMFSRNKALDEVSFTVAPGEIFALLGDNGAGKSTAIRTLLGLVDADRGHARMLGLDARTHGEEIRRQIGYVPDQPVLYEWMSVDQIGWFASGFAKTGYLTDYRSRVKAFGLSPTAKIKSLSKGMKAKVSLALALAGDPPVLVLDEPTSGLDAMVRREFLESMIDVAATGRSVLISSHQIAEVERVADSVGILHAGKLICCEPLDTLKAEIREVDVVGACPHDRDWPGQIIRKTVRGMETRVVLRAAPEADLVQAAEAAGADHAEVRSLSLEEIFIAYLDRRPTESAREVLA